MYSTRKARIALALAAAAAAATLSGVVGCIHAPAVEPEPAATAILPVDEAMQKRDWGRSVAEFESGAIDAGATRFPYVPQTTGDGVSYAALGPERSNAALDTVYFMGQTLALPFTYFVDKPFAKKQYHGVIYEPTHYAMPLLPPDEVPDRDAYAPPPLDDEDADTVPAARSKAPLEPGAIPPLKDRIEPDPDTLQRDTGVPREALPPTITPEGSEPPPGQPGESVTIEPAAPEESAAPVEPAPETPAPEAPAPEVTEPAPEPTPEATEAAPAEPAPEPAPETAEPAPAETAEPAPAEPQPDAPPTEENK